MTARNAPQPARPAPGNVTDSFPPGGFDRAVAALLSSLVAIPAWLFHLVLFSVTTIWCCWLAFDLFAGIPRLDDSVAAVYQARLFGEGVMTWPVDSTVKPWFDLFGIITPVDRPEAWTSMYPPGTAILFTPAEFFGASWIVIPICGGLLVLSIVALARELFDESTARVAGLLAVVSPYLTAVSATHLSHTPAALLVTVSWFSTIRLMRSGEKRHAIVAGGAVGACILFRPETALLVGGAIAIGVVIQFRQALTRWRGLALAAVVAFSGVVALTAWQELALGKAGQSGHEIEMGKGSKFGVNVTVGKHYRFTRPKANNHALGRARVVLDNLVGFPVPVEFLLLAPILLGCAIWRSVWLLLPFGFLSALFYHYWYWEEWLPGRYLFPAVPMLLVLAAWGAVSIGRVFRDVPVIRSVPALLFCAACLWSLAVAGPAYRSFFQPHHADVEDWLPHIISDNGIDNALVFVARESTLHGATFNDYYTTAFLQNTLDLDGPVVFARDGYDRDLQKDNNELIAKYPGRDYYLYTYNQRNRRARIARLIVENGKVTGQQPLPWTGSQLDRR